MSRIAYMAEIDPREVAAIAFVAGMLQGQGVPQGAVIANMLDRIQLVEVPDDFTSIEGSNVVEGIYDDGTAITDFEGEGGAVGSDGGNVLPFPVPVNDEGEELDTDFPPIDVATDPTAPENLGITLNLPAPPPPPGPMGHPDDFGAGPPPREG